MSTKKRIRQFLSKIFNRLISKKVERRIITKDNNFEGLKIDKILKPTFDIINKQITDGEFLILLKYFNNKTKKYEKENHKLKLSKTGKEGVDFEVVIPKLLDIDSVNYPESYGLKNEITIRKNSEEYIVEEDSVEDFRTEYLKIPQILSGKFLNFKSLLTEEKSKYFYRLVIPVEETRIVYPGVLLRSSKNQLKFDIDNLKPNVSDLGKYLQTTDRICIELNIKNIDLHFYAVKSEKAYVIESCKKLEKDEFIEISNAVRIAFAFLSGKFYRDEVYYFSSTENNFSEIIGFDYQKEENSIISKNQVINPQLFYEIYKSKPNLLKQEWRKFHERFPTDKFCNLCEIFLDQPSLLRSVELLINAGYITDPIQKGALYSVSLETILKNFIKGEKLKHLKPVPEEEINSRLKLALKKTLSEFEDDISAEGYKVLKGKIENLNNPTNVDKLKSVFSKVGIELSTDEIEILKKRNLYLHGNKPIKSNSKFELNEVALHMHSLIGQLLLKYVNYEGYYFHLPSLYRLENSDNKISEFGIQDFKDVIDIANISSKIDDTYSKELKSKINIFEELLKKQKDVDELIKII